MDMSGMSMPTGSAGGSMMPMVFYTSTMTPLYSSAWAPSSTGAYAGTCIFLVVLATASRLLAAGKRSMERKWQDADADRRVVVHGKPSESEAVAKDKDAKTGTLVTERGSQESVRIVKRHIRGPAPWRLSVDVPRAFMQVALAGVGYLLMLAVMTFNVGYFLSVLAGIFVGELAVGRYAAGEEH